MKHIICAFRVVSGSRDATLRVWDIDTGECLHVLLGHVAAVRCVQYDGRLVVSGAYDYTVKVWNPEREECLHTLQGHTNRVYSLQVRINVKLLIMFDLLLTELDCKPKQKIFEALLRTMIK